MTDEQLADQLYHVYCVAVGNKAFNGDALPTWDEFRKDPKKKPQSDAWIEVAKAAVAMIKDTAGLES